MPAGLITLALGGFGIGLTEFVIAGLPPDVAVDLHVDAAAAGWLISGYALAVAVGAIGLTAAVTRLPRKSVLLGLMVLFIIGNAFAALATDYPTMLAGRIVAALCHGAFFGIGSVVAAGMVEPDKKARAIAIMFTGADRGERPRCPVRDAARTAARLALHVLGDHGDRRARPHRAGGAGAAIGGTARGRSGRERRSAPALQLRVLRSAETAPTGLGANIAAFNVGNALGAWLGGLTIAAGLGYAPRSGSVPR